MIEAAQEMTVLTLVVQIVSVITLIEVLEELLFSSEGRSLNEDVFGNDDACGGEIDSSVSDVWGRSRPGQFVIDAAHEMTVLVVVVKTVRVTTLMEEDGLLEIEFFMLLVSSFRVVDEAWMLKVEGDTNDGPEVELRVLLVDCIPVLLGLLLATEDEYRMLDTDAAEEVNEGVVEFEPGIAPTLLMKTAESRRASSRSQSMNDSVCEPGAILWLMYSGREVKLYWLTKFELLERSRLLS